jgi:hypothetical protein
MDKINIEMHNWFGRRQHLQAMYNEAITLRTAHRLPEAPASDISALTWIASFLMRLLLKKLFQNRFQSGQRVDADLSLDASTPCATTSGFKLNPAKRYPQARRHVITCL